jgi:hypothetical protein
LEADKVHTLLILDLRIRSASSIFLRWSFFMQVFEHRDEESILGNNKIQSLA